MKPTIAFAVALLAAALPVAAAAQSTAPDPTDLQLEMKRKRAVVLPKQSPEQVRSDADRAVDELAGRRSPGPVVNQTSPVRPPARPDLDRDVRGGIQSQRVNDALRNR
jgi:hypothetical protein